MRRQTLIKSSAVAIVLASLYLIYTHKKPKGEELNLNGSHHHTIVSHVATESIIRKRNIMLFVGIFSAPIRSDRRDAIRETWMKQCERNGNVVCLFFSDAQDVRGMPLQGEIKRKLENESRYYKDLVFAKSPAGLNFGRRILWMYEWVIARYDFQYVLRLDDDYFVCFDKLVDELQHHRPKKLFTWGWLHCRKKGNVRLDEAFIIITRDLIQSFLDRKNSTLLCHAHGGLSIGIWLNAIPRFTTFADMGRVGSLEPDEKIKRRTGDEICQTKLAIHNAYPEEMRIFWNIYQREDKNVKPEIPPVTFNCNFPHGIDVKSIRPPKQPKLCKDNPIWDFGEYWKGSQDKRKPKN